MDFYISDDTRKLIKAKRQIVRLARKTKDPEHKSPSPQIKNRNQEVYKNR